MRSSAAYSMAGDDKDPNMFTHSDGVSNAIKNVFAIDKRTTYVSRMRDIALVDQNWTPSKHHPIPQNMILLQPDTFEETVDHYVEVYTDEEKRRAVNDGLLEFPNILCINWTQDSLIDAIVHYPEFEAFMRCCGQFITDLWIFNCNLVRPAKFVWLVRGFPNLVSLRVADCVLGVSTPRQARLKYHSHPGTGVPLGLESFSLSVRDPTEVDSIYDAMAFTTWLMQEPREDLHSVVLDTAFEFTEMHEEITRSMLHALGSALADVSFKLNEAPDPWMPKKVTVYPDLSSNTRLTSLLFDGLSPGLMPQNYLLSTISTITSPALEQLTLVADLLQAEDASLSFLGLDSLVEHLSYEDNFPSLKLLRLIVVNYADDECLRGEDMWEFVHERVTPLRQKGVQVEYRLECPDDADRTKVYCYDSFRYGMGGCGSEIEVCRKASSLNAWLGLRSYDCDEE